MTSPRVYSFLLISVFSGTAYAGALKFGALAVDSKHGLYYGWSADQGSAANAAAAAVKACKDKGGRCAVVLQYQGPGCASYRTTGDSLGSAYGWGVARTKAEADLLANQHCAKHNGNLTCANMVWSCNSANSGDFRVWQNGVVVRAPAPVSRPITQAKPRPALTKTGVRPVAQPVRLVTWTAPPRRARPTNNYRFDPGTRWKANPQTHTTFAVTPSKQIWFLDPTSNWAFTIDNDGVVFTADPRSGQVYDLGDIGHWSGPCPYFFDQFVYVDGSYNAPTINNYISIYQDNSSQSYDYSTAYQETWNENNAYFESPGLGSEAVPYQYGDYPYDEVGDDLTHIMDLDVNRIDGGVAGQDDIDADEDKTDDNGTTDTADEDKTDDNGTADTADEDKTDDNGTADTADDGKTDVEGTDETTDDSKSDDDAASDTADQGPSDDDSPGAATAPTENTSAEEDAYQHAIEDGSAEALKAFLDQYPDSPHDADVQEREDTANSTDPEPTPDEIVPDEENGQAY